MPIRILFVDDETNVLDGLRRMLRSMRNEWETAFAPGGAEALALLETQAFDVIVSDMRMPRMDGAQLLNEVRERWPHMVRIILSGHSDYEMILKSIGPSHQYLTKPCEPTLLRRTIDRAVALSRLLSDVRARPIVSMMDNIPSMPTLYADLVAELQRSDSSLQRVGEIIAQDVGMTAQVLRLVNSAYFGLRQPINNPSAAVTYLGISTVTALVMTLHLFQQVPPTIRGWLEIDRNWAHGMRTAVMARAVAECETKDRRFLDDAFTAGLIHDAGRLTLGTNLSETYRKCLEGARRSGVPIAVAERRYLGVTHGEVGAYLIGLWGLPNSIVEALAHHPDPSACVHPEFSTLTAVHVACTFENARHAGTSVEENGSQGWPWLDMAYIQRLGLTGRLPVWRESCEAIMEAAGEEGSSESGTPSPGGRLETAGADDHAAASAARHDGLQRELNRPLSDRTGPSRRAA
jgi:HD-like signal output (HDOD) protein/CheY-like chemotaxis protein